MPYLIGVLGLVCCVFGAITNNAIPFALGCGLIAAALYEHGKG